MDDRLRTLERQAHERGDALAWRDYATALTRAGRRDEALLAALHARGLDPDGPEHDLLAQETPAGEVRDLVEAALAGPSLHPGAAHRYAARRPLVAWRAAWALSATDRGRAQTLAEACALTPGTLQAYAALDLSRLPPARRWNDEAPRLGALPLGVARLAAMLGCRQARETLGAVTALAAGRRDLDDVLACLVQERVVRGEALEDDPAARALAARHPLAGGEPLALRALEQGARALLRSYGAEGGSSWSGWSVTRLEPTGPVPAADARVVAERQPPAELEEELARFVAQNHNVQLEVRAFVLDRPVDRLGPELLASLGLECLRDATALSVAPLTAGQLHDELFALFASGGCYGEGLLGAQGRALTWRTLRWLGLADSPRPAAFFAARSAWFTAMLDMAVAVLRPTGDVAVLAATDTD